MNDLQFNVVTLLLVDGTEMLVRAEDIRTVRRNAQNIAAVTLRNMEADQQTHQIAAQRVAELEAYNRVQMNAQSQFFAYAPNEAAGIGAGLLAPPVRTGRPADATLTATAARQTCLVRLYGYGNDFTVYNPHEELDRWMRNS